MPSRDSRIEREFPPDPALAERVTGSSSSACIRHSVHDWRRGLVDAHVLGEFAAEAPWSRPATAEQLAGR